MAPSPSPELVSPAEGELLLDLAEGTLDRALSGGRPHLPALAELPPALQHAGDAFVTLHVAGELNGCIGALDTGEPLGHAVVRLAVAAAFEDPRLPALRPHDRAHLAIEVSLLSPRSSIPARSLDELTAALHPGRDGLVVQSGYRRGLFLPDVWDQLPHPLDFLAHLWRKAGLRPGTWPNGLVASRFHTQRHERHTTAESSLGGPAARGL